MNEEQILTGLFESYTGIPAEAIVQLPGSGSGRRYYRLYGKEGTIIGVCNDDQKENAAFLSFTEAFHSAGLPVPMVLHKDLSGIAYLLEDLGDTTLFGYLTEQRKSKDEFPAELVPIYEKVIAWLPKFQIRGKDKIDFSCCYPRAAFDRQSMMWDLNYFKYYFLKLAKVAYDEQLLENDFNTLVDFLEGADSNFFMYRDFQSRNILLKDGDPWFIDYQGGRKGALQYDIASLLYDAKADIPEPFREQLLERYIEILSGFVPVDNAIFIGFFDGFALIRILQALGAYGFRGYYENKPHFLQSIPYAMENLRTLLKKDRIPVKLPVLASLIREITENPAFRNVRTAPGQLVISISSFSYKKGYPKDNSRDGGGFVFDCRALPNPGKFEKYNGVTGKDQSVIDFLKREQAVDTFLNHVYSLVDQSVKRYIERDFTTLSVNFGCTGGQHRSVYCAELLAAHLNQKFGVKVILNHSEL